MEKGSRPFICCGVDVQDNQMNQSQQQQQHKIKVEDGKRVQRILDELNAKHAASGKSGPVSMDETAKQMFIDYANELTISVLEASSLLAQHRNSKTIDAEDVNAILCKSSDQTCASVFRCVTYHSYSICDQTKSWA